MDYIDGLIEKQPRLVEPLGKLGDLFSRKLWHQLTDEVVAFLQNPDYATLVPSYADFYTGFVSKFEVKINQLRFALVASLLARHAETPQAALELYSQLLENKRERLGPEAALFLDMEVVLVKLKQNELKDVESSLKAGKQTLDGLAGAEAMVHSNYYRAASEYHKVAGPPESFYKNALMFLAYTPIDSLSTQDKYSLATDISLAALTGDGVFNFGEVLSTPILDVLEQTPNAWLSQVLRSFDAGDVDQFALLVEQNRAAYQSQPALVNRQELVKEKVVLLSLMNLVFETPAHDRTIPFAAIAQRGRLPVEQVEWLLMRAMSLKLIKGVIDEVEHKVSITWVQPRVLNKEQVTQLASRLEGWSHKVHETLQYVENDTVELLN